MNDVFDFRRVFKPSTSQVDLTKYTDRQKIEILEWVMLRDFDNIADELPLTHFIHGGIYAREIFIPAGVVLTGKVHLVDHLFSLDQGELSVMTDKGIKRISAPFKFEVKAGIKKVGYAHTDVMCTTYHSTDLTDVKEIEDTLFRDSNVDWVGKLFKETKKGVLLCQ